MYERKTFGKCLLKQKEKYEGQIIVALCFPKSINRIHKNSSSFTDCLKNNHVVKCPNKHVN